MAVYLVTNPRVSGTSGKRSIPHTDTRTGEPVEPVVAEITGRTVRSFLTDEDARTNRQGKDLVGGIVRLTGDMPDPSDPLNAEFWADRAIIDGQPDAPDATDADKARNTALRTKAAQPRPAKGRVITGTYTTAIVQPVVQYVLAHPDATPAEALQAILSAPIDVDKPRKVRADTGPRVDVMAQLVNAISAAQNAAKAVSGPADKPAAK